MLPPPGISLTLAAVPGSGRLVVLSHLHDTPLRTGRDLPLEVGTLVTSSQMRKQRLTSNSPKVTQLENSRARPPHPEGPQASVLSTTGGSLHQGHALRRSEPLFPTVRQGGGSTKALGICLSRT